MGILRQQRHSLTLGSRRAASPWEGIVALEILYPDLAENNLYERNQQSTFFCGSGNRVHRTDVWSCRLPEKRYPGHEQPESTGADRPVAGSSSCGQPGPCGRDPGDRYQRSAAASKPGAAAELSAACARPKLFQ